MRMKTMIVIWRRLALVTAYIQGPACSQNTAQTHWWRSPYSRTLSSERPRLNCCRGPTRITQWPVSCPPLAANDARGTAEAVSLVGERTVDAHWLRFPLIRVCRGEMGIGHCGCCGWSSLAKLDVTCRRRVVAVRTRGASDTRLSIQHLHRGMSQWKSPVIGTGGGAAFLAETQSYCLNVLLFSCRSLRSDSGRSLNTHADSMSGLIHRSIDIVVVTSLLIAPRDLGGARQMGHELLVNKPWDTSYQDEECNSVKPQYQTWNTPYFMPY